tara:strand:+ start:101 stop:1111 length:1011 start_codon:yes stop_codon:yes gene_type:complete
MGLGINISSQQNKRNINQFTWTDRQYAQFNGTDQRIQLNLGTAERIAAFMEDLEGGTTNFFADEWTVSFWVKPTWTYKVDGTISEAVLTNASGHEQGEAIGFMFWGDKDSRQTSGHNSFIHFQYDLRTGSDFRGRLYAYHQEEDGSSDDKNIEGQALHNENTICGLGSSNGLTSAWHSGNVGNANSDGFVHLTFVKQNNTVGVTNFKMYWNAQDIGVINYSGWDAGTVENAAESMDFIELGFTSFGVDSGSDENFENFGMRDLAIFKGELSALEVAAIYAGGAFKDWRDIAVGSNELKHYWPLSGHAHDIASNQPIRGDFNNVEHGASGTLIWQAV